MAVSQVGCAGHAVPALCAVPIHILPEGLESGCCCGGRRGSHGQGFAPLCEKASMVVLLLHLRIGFPHHDSAADL